MTLANASYLGIERCTQPTQENWTNSSENDRAALIRAAYQQVFGYQYILSSDRLEGPESLFRRGYLSTQG